MKEMPYICGIHMRLYPSNQQKAVIRQNSDAARFVYNRCVAIGKELYALKKTTIYLEPVANRIAFLENQFKNVKQMSNLAPFLNGASIDAQAKANAVQNYNKAWNQFHKVPGTSIPTFHRKSDQESYQTNPHYVPADHSVLEGTGVRFLDESHIILPILGRIRIKGSVERIRSLLARTSETRIGTVTIKKEADNNYYVSMQLGSMEPFASTLPKTKKAAGIDVNLENFCTDSNGAVVENPRYKRSMQKKLSKAQRKLSRRMERAKKEHRPLSKAKNYQKQRIKVAKINGHSGRQRKDFLHCLSKHYIENQDIIGIEDLKVKNLLKNHCLAYSIADAAWGTFRQFLTYKGDLYRKSVIAVKPHFTTQTCNTCGRVLEPMERLTLRDRSWTCPGCGAFHERDLNAAKNIRDEAVRIYQAQFAV